LSSNEAFNAINPSIDPFLSAIQIHLHGKQVSFLTQTHQVLLQ